MFKLSLCPSDAQAKADSYPYLGGGGGGEGVVVATPLGLLQHIKHSTQKGMYLFSYVYVYLNHVNVHTGINDAVS